MTRTPETPTTEKRVLDPKELLEITADAEIKEMKKEDELRKKKAQTEQDLRESFMSRDVAPNVTENVMAVVTRAAKAGKREVLALRFPSSFCTDRGRAINNSEPGWPETLEGFPKRAVTWFDQNMKPHGYRLRAEILNFPGGVPGEVGIYIRW
jgi:hypothetical protein